MSDIWSESCNGIESVTVAPEVELVENLLKIRPTRTDLSDEEFINEAGFLIIQKHVAPILQDAIGLNGEDRQAEIFPMARVLANLGHAVTADFVALQKGLEKQ